MAEFEELAELLKRGRRRQQMSPATRERQLATILAAVEENQPGQSAEELDAEPASATTTLETVTYLPRAEEQEETEPSAPVLVALASTSSTGYAGSGGTTGRVFDSSSTRRRMAASVAPVMLALASLTVGLTVVASRSVPGEWAHPVKLAAERIQVVVDSEAAARHRVDELEHFVYGAQSPAVVVKAQRAAGQAIGELEAVSSALATRYAALAVGSPDGKGFVDAGYVHTAERRPGPLVTRTSLPDGAILTLATGDDDRISVSVTEPWDVTGTAQDEWDVYTPTGSGQQDLRIRVVITQSEVILSVDGHDATVAQPASAPNGDTDGRSRASGTYDSTSTVIEDSEDPLGPAPIGRTTATSASPPTSSTARPTTSAPTTTTPPSTTEPPTTTRPPTTKSTTTQPPTTSSTTTTVTSTTQPPTTSCDDDGDDDDDECDDD